MRPKLNTPFFVRALILVLAVAAVGLTGLTGLVRLLPRWLQIGPDLGPTPPPPTITAARGALPAGPVGLEEWPRYAGGEPVLVGSGFVLQLADGTVVGVTTAHSVATLGRSRHTLESIAFARPGQADFSAEFDTLHGPPGSPRLWADLSGDYVLLRVTQPLPSDLLLHPDPRGGPEPGERVVLFSGLGDGNGGPRPLPGTVMTAQPTGIWVLMDETFDAGRMSGSPLISQHTGQVVGMAIAVARRGERMLIGFHPIGHLVALAQAASEFPQIAGYVR